MEDFVAGKLIELNPFVRRSIPRSNAAPPNVEQRDSDAYQNNLYDCRHLGVIDARIISVQKKCTAATNKKYATKRSHDTDNYLNQLGRFFFGFRSTIREQEILQIRRRLSPFAPK